MEPLNIVFHQTAHAADDDRVWHHQAKTLLGLGHTVHVVASSANFITNDRMTLIPTNNTSLCEKIKLYTKTLENLNPDIIICDTPVAVNCARKLKKNNKRLKIIHDITEWYPSKKNLNGLNLVKKCLKFIALALANWTVNLSTDGFVFGEKYKARPFRILFPWKPFVMLPYYPDLQYIKPIEVGNIENTVRLFYAGDTTEEKGFPNVLEVAKLVAKRNAAIQVVLDVVTIGKIPSIVQKPENLEISFKSWLPFEEFCRVATGSDLFLDLRTVDFENTRCLPIKLFYYMAMQRPVIYSDLKAVREDYPEVLQCGLLVRPDDYETIVSIIEEYIQNPAKYREHAANARRLAEEKYNWNAVKQDFTEFVESLWV